MAKGVAVDANVMKGFTFNYIREEVCPARSLVEKIERTSGFAIDRGGKLRQQWLDTCGNRSGSPFFEWFFQKVKEGVIREVDATLHHHRKKALWNDCGLPRDRYEITYIEVANVTDERYLVSEDIRFFDPTLKLADEDAKTYAKTNRRGRVCQYLKTMDICVGTVDHALDQLP